MTINVADDMEDSAPVYPDDPPRAAPAPARENTATGGDLEHLRTAGANMMEGLRIKTEVFEADYVSQRFELDAACTRARMQLVAGFKAQGDDLRRRFDAAVEAFDRDDDTVLALRALERQRDAFRADAERLTRALLAMKGA